MTFQLRDYQRAAVDGLYDYWTQGKGEHPLIVAPTGSGKTLIIAQIVSDAMSYDGTRVMILSHVKELLEQNGAGLTRHYPQADIGYYSAGIGQKRLGHRVTIAGIQSVWQKAFKMIPPPDLVLIDEAHMLPKKDTTRYARFIADLQLANPSAKIVGLTATPYRLDSGLLHEGKGAVFDGIAYDIPIEQLMREGWLSPVVSRCGKKEIDLSNVRKRGGEYVESDLALAASDDELVRATVQEICDLGAKRQAWLIFASGVEHAEMLAEGIRDHGYSAEVVTGSDNKADRASKIARFRDGNIRALVNCNVLTTGFDVPRVDMVAIVRATASTGLYVQIVGRGTRLFDGKENCLILDFGGNVARHGFLDQIKPHKQGGTGDGDAPVKKCPECNTFCPTAVAFCGTCGHEFPPRALNHTHTAYSGAMLSYQQTKPEWIDVEETTYQKWSKPGKPDSIRVTYKCGLKRYSEWICPDHGGFATDKYRMRMPQLGAKATTTAAALMECPFWNKPKRIKVAPDGKYDKIVQLDYKGVQVLHEAL